MRKTIAVAVAVLAMPEVAAAFCGFYVSGADSKLFNDATMVVMMREGTRTVLSMQNDYQGPPENFAMVIPVPVVLQEENVKTLPREIFERVDQLASPRLVEYWEDDPCRVYPKYKYDEFSSGMPVPSSAPPQEGRPGDLGVKIEAQFKVGEYDIVILSAQDSTGLDTWLRLQKYKIPEGSEPFLRPYVQGGSKFFVAKVDVEKVKFEGNKAVLSPLRFHYDSEKFELPVRLGLVNSAGEQDVIVHILAKDRYELANFENVTIPTNILVGEITKQQFGEFYLALFAETMAKNPKAVVTEYSWDAGSCDPCPGEPLQGEELMTLGADVIPDVNPQTLQWGGGMTLTRLHARYTKDSLGEDLVFRKAKPIIGGRGTPDAKGQLHEKGSTESSINNFQGRYIILHPWTGKVACKDPQRGRWGGPPGKNAQAAAPPPAAAKNLAFAPRGKADLPAFLAQDIPELAIKAAPAAAGSATRDPVKREDSTKARSCGCSIDDPQGVRALIGGAILLGALVFVTRRKRS